MKKVLLLLAKGFEVYEASVFTDVIGWNLVDGDRTTEVITCGLKKEVKSTFNLRVITDITIDEVNVDDYAALAIPGGFEEYGFYEDAYDEKFLQLIREFHEKNKIIASICVAALPVGKSKILEGKKGTTYNMKNGIRQEKLREYGVNVVNEPIVIDDNIITSWNPSTAMDVAFKLLELLTSKEKSDYIRKIMGFNVL
ncbi:MAG: DJ-1/PfpI family protein [Clostridium sp.]|uniref:DJ-1/PfpI family protein n=1 Tax=Clostridium sp. TaxID=1506 RepID=UPI0039EC70B8